MGRYGFWGRRLGRYGFWGRRLGRGRPAGTVNQFNVARGRRIVLRSRPRQVGRNLPELRRQIGQAGSKVSPGIPADLFPHRIDQFLVGTGQASRRLFLQAQHLPVGFAQLGRREDNHILDKLGHVRRLLFKGGVCLAARGAGHPVPDPLDGVLVGCQHPLVVFPVRLAKSPGDVEVPRIGGDNADQAALGRIGGLPGVPFSPQIEPGVARRSKFCQGITQAHLVGNARPRLTPIQAIGNRGGNTKLIDKDLPQLDQIGRPVIDGVIGIVGVGQVRKVDAQIRQRDRGIEILNDLVLALGLGQPIFGGKLVPGLLILIGQIGLPGVRRYPLIAVPPLLGLPPVRHLAVAIPGAGHHHAGHYQPGCRTQGAVANARRCTSGPMRTNAQDAGNAIPQPGKDIGVGGRNLLRSLPRGPAPHAGQDLVGRCPLLGLGASRHKGHNALAGHPAPDQLHQVLRVEQLPKISAQGGRDRHQGLVLVELPLRIPVIGRGVQLHLLQRLLHGQRTPVLGHHKRAFDLLPILAGQPRRLRIRLAEVLVVPLPAGHVAGLQLRLALDHAVADILRLVSGRLRPVSRRRQIGLGLILQAHQTLLGLILQAHQTLLGLLATVAPHRLPGRPHHEPAPLQPIRVIQLRLLHCRVLSPPLPHQPVRLRLHRPGELLGVGRLRRRKFLSAAHMDHPGPGNLPLRRRIPVGITDRLVVAEPLLLVPDSLCARGIGLELVLQGH